MAVGTIRAPDRSRAVVAYPPARVVDRPSRRQVVVGGPARGCRRWTPGNERRLSVSKRVEIRANMAVFRHGRPRCGDGAVGAERLHRRGAMTSNESPRAVDPSGRKTKTGYSDSAVTR